MSSTPARGDEAAPRGIAARLGITSGMIVQEIGYDDDIDQELRDAVEEIVGDDFVGEDTDDVIDVALLWFREDDGDLVDALVDAIGPLADSGVIWLLTPKRGRAGHVEPSDIAEAAPTAGLAQTSTMSVGPDWSAVRLATPKTSRVKR